MDHSKRKIVVIASPANLSALEAIYKDLQSHQLLDLLQITFLTAEKDTLFNVLDEATNGFDAIIVMPLKEVDVPKLWRQKWSSLNEDALQVFINNGLRYIKLINENSNDAGLLTSTEKIATRIEQFAEILKSMFRLPLPRLAVMSTSKTADGKATKEDKELLQPAIQKAFEKLIPVFGTFSNTAFFASESYLRFDGFCFVFQEQADAILQQIGGISILFEAEAPVVLATPVAPSSNSIEEVFRETIYLVKDVLNNQKEYAEMSKNPLKFELKRENNEFQAF